MDPTEEQLRALKKWFGHTEFRPKQWEIINSIISDKRDNLAVLPSNHGKSLCYQYPTMYCGGVTIVLTPTIALMVDQIRALAKLNIPACLLGDAQPDNNRVKEEILENKYSFVYMTPKYFSFNGALLLYNMKDIIRLIAVDEAHCISIWGHAFYHSYQQLDSIKEMLPNVPILACTATANKRVRDDIVKCLQLSDPQISTYELDRPNLYFSVEEKSSRGIVFDLLRVGVINQVEETFSGPTIIYCITKGDVKRFIDTFEGFDIDCVPYDASMTIADRNKNHQKFLDDECQVLVATVTFGLGIDKPNVRNVIHYGASKNIEDYYIETGRSGRDGQPAKCIVFYNDADFEQIGFMRDTNIKIEEYRERSRKLNLTFENYLKTTDCRRKFILEHLEEREQKYITPTLNCCDNCTKSFRAMSEVGCPIKLEETSMDKSNAELNDGKESDIQITVKEEAKENISTVQQDEKLDDQNMSSPLKKQKTEAD